MSIIASTLAIRIKQNVYDDIIADMEQGSNNVNGRLDLNEAIANGATEADFRDTDADSSGEITSKELE